LDIWLIVLLEEVFIKWKWGRVISNEPQQNKEKRISRGKQKQTPI